MKFNETQNVFDLSACTPSAAVASLISEEAGIGDVVMVHPVFRFTLKPDGQKLLASIKRIVLEGGMAQGPLLDCFTHPSASMLASYSFKGLNRRKAIMFSQDLEELFLRYFPQGIEWPGLGDGENYCTHCFSVLSECTCGD